MAQINSEVAAELLLNRYQKPGHPSAGDVLRLKERIEEILVNEFGVSRSNL